MNLLKNILITLLFIGGISAPALAEAIPHCDSAGRWEDCDCNEGEIITLDDDGESWCEVLSGEGENDERLDSEAPVYFIQNAQPNSDTRDAVPAAKILIPRF